MLLRVAAPGAPPREVELAAGELTVGRQEGNGLTVADQRLSRRHLKLRVAGDKLFVSDLGSANGTIVNEQKIGAETELKPGDCVRAGATTFTVLGAAPVPAPPAGALAGAGRADKPARSSESACRLEVDVVGADAAMVSVIKQIDIADHLQGAQKKDRLAAMYRLSETIGTVLNLSELLDRLLQLVAGVLPVERAAVLLCDEASGKLLPRACWEHGSAAVADTLRISSSIAEQTLQRGTGLLISDTGADARLAGQQSIMALRIRSALCVPLIARGQKLGIIYLDSSAATGGSFTEDDLGFLSVLGAQAALFIDNLRLFERVQREERQRQNLSRFLSPRVLERVLAAPEGGVLGGQYQETTILFADIRNFSALTQQLKPEQLVGILNEYYTAMTEIIFRFEGTLDNFIGDAIMAEFGVPFPQSDDPFRAVAAALAMRQELAVLRKKWLPHKLKQFEVGFGINTGKVIAGNIGSAARMQYTVIGEPVNIASRISGRATANQILITDATWKQLGASVKTNKLLPMTLKGSTTGVQVYEVLD